MTIYYVRPGTGSDTHSGLSPAAAWQTLSQTSSILAPGDEVRIEASPSVLISSSAAWSFGTTSVVVPTQLTLNLFLCESAFTQSFHPSITLGTTAVRKQGNVASTISVTAPMSGPLAYRTVAPINASAFHCVNLWLRSTAPLPASALAIELCNDAVGLSVVASLPILYAIPANTWVPLVLNYGGALPSSIQSLRITALSTLPVTVLTVDNIFCSRTAPLSSTVDLHSLVGFLGSTALPFATLLFPIRYVVQSGSNTEIGFDAHIDDIATTPKARSPLSGVFSLHRVVPFVLPPSLTPTQNYTTPHPLRTPWGSIHASGAVHAPIHISGGWDPTTFTTQQGETAIACLTPFGEALRFNGHRFLRLRRLRFLGFSTGAVLDGQYIVCETISFHRTQRGVETQLLPSGDEPLVGLQNFAVVGGDAPQIAVRHGRVAGALGVCYAGKPAAPCIQVQPDAAQRRPQLEVQRVFTWDCGFPLEAASDVLIRGGDFTVLRDTPAFSVRVAPPSVFHPKIVICDSVFTPSFVAETVLPGMDFTQYEVRFHQPNYSLVDHRIVMDTGVIVPDSMVFQTPPRSWRCMPNEKAREANPMIVPLGPIWRQGSSTSPVQVVVRRSHANIQIRIRIFGGQIPTIVTSPLGLTAVDTGPILTWNTISLPISMLVSSGTFDMQAEIWTTDGSTSHACWIDSIL